MFGAMRIYTVHIDPEEVGAAQKPVFVREGFNIFAFLFGAFWALYHRLWQPFFLILLLNGALMFAGKEQLISTTSLSILQLSVNVFFGLQGNDWIRSGLTRRGYILADVAVADSLLRAQQRYFDRYLLA